jgi:hypothetical protein
VDVEVEGGMSQTVEPVDPGVLREIHRSMIDLWQRGYALPIRWTLASFSNPAVVVSGKTAENTDSAKIATTTSDGTDLPSTFPLPACLVATDARGQSVTGLVPWAPDAAA